MATYSQSASVEAVRQAMVTAELIELGMQNTPVDFLSELAENVHGTSGVSVSSVQWEVEDLLIDTSRWIWSMFTGLRCRVLFKVILMQR